MIKSIKINDWIIDFYIKINESDKNAIQSKIKKMTPEYQQKINDNLVNDNRGTTIANLSKKTICVLISNQTSKSEMLNTLSHEIRHVVDILCRNCNIEDAAYTTGEITSQFADLL